MQRQVKLPWTSYDWRDLPASTHSDQLQDFLETDRSQGFVLDQAPLLRLALIQTDGDVYWFIWTNHHMLLDGWSRAQVMQEVLVSYKAFVTHQMPDMPPARPYREYIHWLQRQNQNLAEQYWRKQLAHFTTPTPLPHDKGSHNSGAMARKEILLSESTTHTLQSFVQQHGLTLNTVVQAAWALLLSRSNGETDIVVGATVAGRPAELLDNTSMVGLFINTLPVRIIVSPKMKLVDWLLALQREQAELRQYEHTPLIQVHGWSEIPRGTPLFESIYVFENYPVDAVVQQQRSEITISETHFNDQTNYPLNLLVGIDEQVDIQLGYDTARFTASAIDRMLMHLSIIIDGMVTIPDQLVGHIPWISPAERQHLLYEVNATTVLLPPNITITDLIMAQVACTPQDIAVSCSDMQLTYNELAVQANVIASLLLTYGVSAEIPVGIFVDRSPAMLVAMLGVLLSGGAYIPLDPSFPTERLQWIMEDSGMQLVLTLPALKALLPSHIDQVLCLEPNGDLTTPVAPTNNSRRGKPYALSPAYVIYTSGSTGQPKGVVVTHQALVNFLESMRHTPGIAAADTLFAVTTFSFDIAMLELFLPLLVGAQVVIATADETTDAQLLRTRLVETGATYMQATPATWRMLLDDGWEGQQKLTILCGGEALPRDLAQALLPRCNALWNMYGPTETTIWSATQQITETDTAITIGPPIANTQLYVLDDMYQPVPIGVPGHLYIGGNGLARGYLNRPDLTAERFVPHPFSVIPNARLYRTGDLARYHEDGTIEYIGRDDLQVKVRGFRIELGEIESVLGQHPSVHQTVVLAREDVPGERYLAAYIVPTSEQSFDTQELRQFLQKQIPAYMIPSVYVSLTTFPLTPNRKIDRRALPAPEGVITASTVEFVAPRTPTEEMVAGIWANILHQPQVGAFDNFFALGGHSLLATRLIAHIRDTFHVNLPMRSVFETATVAELATQIEQLRHNQKQSALPPIIPVERSRVLPLSFAQERLWVVYQFAPDSPAYNLSVAVRVTGSIDTVRLERSLYRLIQRHETLRTNIGIVDGQTCQIIAPELQPDIVFHDLQSMSKADQETYVQRELEQNGQQPFNLTDGALLRTHLFCLTPEEHILQIVIHHIVTDGWSQELLVRDLMALYSTDEDEQEVDLPSLTIQYADYATWQRQWFHGETLETQLDYWRNQLAELPTLTLSTDRPRPAVQTDRGARYPVTLSSTVSNELTQLAQREGATLFMTLLAAFHVFLCRYSGQHDTVIGTPISGRTHPEVDSLIGCFVNLLVMRADTAGNPTFRQFLRQVRTNALDAYAHQDMPFEQLVDVLQPIRDMSRFPLFQVAFMLGHQPRAFEPPSGLTLHALEAPNVTAKYDLVLDLQTSAEGLQGTLEYNTDLFDMATIARLVQHFQTLLNHIVVNPNQQLADLSLITATERNQLLNEWNATQVDYPRNVSIPRLFADQAADTPTALACVFDDQRLTYAELDQRTNQLAHYLGTCGVIPGNYVAVCLERSVDFVVAIIAILKAGAAYVPLDPTYPAERIAMMLADSQARVVLTQAYLAEYFASTQLMVIALDGSHASAISQQPTTFPSVALTAEHPAYMMYTSGSTGQPKGVIIPHCAISRLVLHTNYITLSARDRIAWASNTSFDASTFELWAALLNGGCVVHVPQQILLDPAQLGTYLHEQAITTLFVTTALFNQVAYHAPKSFMSLQYLLFGGEAVDPIAVQTILEQGRPQHLLHVYGPTESTTFATWCEVKTIAPMASTVPIGAPLTNTQTYILDETFQPVPIGVAGELCVGGDGLATAYFARPALTASKFVPHPYSQYEGVRLYRTGDQARWRDDGTIEFMGRFDHQIKLRGFRIELGEIEVALGQHPGVHEVLVVLQENDSEKRLIAYLTQPSNERVTVDELRDFLQTRLPEFMIPAVFMVLEQFPLTPNGKVDRKALPQPENSRPALAEAYVAPRTPVEEMVAEIWRDVLEIDQIGIHDSFFSLGGNSLMATQIVARLQSVFYTAVSLRQLFETPTIAELVAAFTQVQAEQFSEDQMTELLAQLEELSDEEAQSLLSQTSSRE
ncbi:MAG: amino acid adenylation domain-containing protein [Chloroflexota bacterium]